MQKEILTLSSRISVMLMGAPGIGKTAMVTDFAATLDADLLDIRLSSETPSSFEGKDYIHPDGTLHKARAWWLQRIERNRDVDRPTVLFFDEYTNAPDALQQLAYSPFNERKLHGVSFDYTLKNGAPGLYVFAAGNRVEDETGAREMIYAAKTRVFTVDFSVSVKEWLIWAETHGIHQTVRAFLYTNPDALLEKPSTGTACPREWANLSTALYCGIDYREAAHGTVRGSYEASFCSFYRDAKLCPTIADIVSGKAKIPDKVHLSAFAPVLVAALKEDEKAAEHFPAVYHFVSAVSEECEVMFAKYAVDDLTDLLISDHTCAALMAKLAKKLGVKAL